MAAKYPKVKVRMYRQGLGDCFLLTLMASSRKKKYMLIDCGVFLGTKDSKQKMLDIAEDVTKVTQGTVDVVVATHEHYDHLSGFNLARDKFDPLKMSEIWMAWTEDPENELANILRGDRHFRLAAIRQALVRIKALNAHSNLSHQLEEVLNFFGISTDESAPDLAATDDFVLAAGRRTIADAIEFLKEKGNEEDSQLKYLQPSDTPIVFEDIPGLRIFVLGPPIDEVLIKKSDPTKRGKEVYEEEQHFSLDQSFSEALFMTDDLINKGAANENNDYPFSKNYKTFNKSNKKLHPLHQRYLDGKSLNEKDEDHKDYSWRNIDTDWLKAVEKMALKLDSDTNNTSLVLAIEIERTGEVLLFPGDAQVGNWLSWENVTWTLKDENGEDKIVTAHDLLRRTSFYKVGHHGSHNATLRDKGLELMERKDLVAMIPVEETMVARRKWNMPYPPLLKRLHDKTRGRVIRADRGLAEQDDPLNDNPMTDRQWAKFKKDLKVTDLYIEYTVGFS